MDDGSKDFRREDGRLVVAVRVRPLSKRELNANAEVVVNPQDEKTICVTDPEPDELEDILKRQRQRDYIYQFDNVFGSDKGQEEIYTKSAQWLIEGVLQGFNCSVFAYGATGTGKTYTMLGTDDEQGKGIIPRTMIDLFARVEETKRSSKEEFSITMTYLEIYNETIRDLISGSSESLDLRETGTDAVVVSGITHVETHTASDVLQALYNGSRNRSTEATGANEVSSRSHAVLQIHISRRPKTAHADDNLATTTTKLSMIDLAGSERAQNTNNRGMRMVEGASINRSLLALANCINALVDGPGKKGGYVNYRDSKLTRLLKDSLGGNCKTVMIANISPASIGFDETQNTLKYASRARNIKTNLTQQVVYKNNPYASINLAQKRLELDLARQTISSAPGRRIKKSASEMFSRKMLAAMDHNVPHSMRVAGFGPSKSMRILREKLNVLRQLMIQERQLRSKIEDMNEANVEIGRLVLAKQRQIEMSTNDSRKEAKALEKSKKELQERLENDEKEKQILHKDLRSLQRQIMDVKDLAVFGVDDDSSSSNGLDRMGQQYLQLLIKTLLQESDISVLIYALQVAQKMIESRDRTVVMAQEQLAILDAIATEQRRLLNNQKIPQSLLKLYEKGQKVLAAENANEGDDAQWEIRWKLLEGSLSESAMKALKTDIIMSRKRQLTQMEMELNVYTTVDEPEPVVQKHKKEFSFSPPPPRRKVKSSSTGYYLLSNPTSKSPSYENLLDGQRTQHIIPSSQITPPLGQDAITKVTISSASPEVISSVPMGARTPRIIPTLPQIDSMSTIASQKTNTSRRTQLIKDQQSLKSMSVNENEQEQEETRTNVPTEKKKDQEAVKPTLPLLPTKSQELRNTYNTPTSIAQKVTSKHTSRISSSIPISNKVSSQRSSTKAVTSKTSSAQKKNDQRAPWGSMQQRLVAASKAYGVDSNVLMRSKR